MEERSFGRKSLDAFQRSRRLQRRALEEIPEATSSNYRGATSYSPYPMIFMDEGSGATLTDVDGNEYIDFHAGVSSIIVGHAPEAQTRAVADRLERGSYFATTYEREHQAAALVNELVPCADLTKFISTGTEAVMTAIRLARAYTGRETVIKFEGMYHGHADDVLVNVHPSTTDLGTRRRPTKIPAANGIPSSAFQAVETLPWNDPELLAERLDAAGGEVAAVITEAVMSNSGLVWPTGEYLERVRALTDDHDVVFILDEVVTGFRMGLHGAQGHFGVEPDIAILGKALANGYPNAAVTGREDLMRFIKAEPDKATFMGTFSGNPVVVEATHANLQHLREIGVSGYRAMHERADRLTTGLQEVLDDSTLEAHVTDHAGFFFVHFLEGEKDPTTWRDWRDVERHTDEDRYERFAAGMIGEGIFFPPKVGRINMMHAHTDEHVDRAIEAAKVAIENVPA